MRLPMLPPLVAWSRFVYSCLNQQIRHFNVYVKYTKVWMCEIDQSKMKNISSVCFSYS